MVQYSNYHLKNKIAITLLFQLLVLIEKYLKSNCIIKIASMKNIENFPSQKRKPLCATTKSKLFTVSKGEWNTKEGTRKSLKNALYVLRYAKRHLLGGSNVKQ